ncbi:hypothetical protein [Nostoc sp.]
MKLILRYSTSHLAPSSSPTQNCWVDVGRGAGEQGSRGEAYTKFFPLCPSAPLLTTMQSFLGRLLVLCQANFAG